MALQVWLPLNGDLHNQGLSTITFSNLSSSNTTINTSGKIGKCYNNNSNSAGGLLSNTTINLGQKQSMFCWFKFITLESSSSLGGALISQHRYPANTGMGITLKYVSSTTGYLSINTGTGSSRTYNQYCGTTLLQANTWYHGGYTYDNGIVKIYVNGNCEYTGNIGTMSVPADYLTVFCWSMGQRSGNAVHGNYKLNGCINDVRIYDHCLSEQEIKEIARGLILHYSLNNNGLGGENLFSWANNVTGITLNNYQNTGSFTQFTNSLQFDPSLTVGEKYTISFWAKSPNGTTSLLLYNSNGNPKYFYFSTTLTNNLSTEWQFFKYTVTNTQYNGSNTPSTNSSVWKRIEIYAPNKMGVIVKQIKIEKGEIATQWSPAKADTIYPNALKTIIFDQSGYGYNGTITGTLTTITPSPQYNCGIKFNGGAYIKTLNEFNTDNSTIAVWVYTDLTQNGVHLLDARNDSSVGKQPIYIYSNGSIQTGGSAQYVATNTGLLEANIWIHLCLVQSGDSLLVYKNGMLFQTLSCTNSSLIKSTLGARFNISNTFKGQISDFRIYVTALSAADVKALYRNSMIVSGVTKTPRDLE